MSVMSVRISEEKKKQLKVAAAIEGKTIGGLVEDLINKYVSEKQEINDYMKLSENSFNEWDNEEDEIYNSL